MKAKIEIDATPQELRTLFGLPDVESLQQEMLEKLRAKMDESLENSDPAALMKLFMPMPDQMKSFQSLQESFLRAMTKGMDLSAGEKKG